MGPGRGPLPVDQPVCERLQLPVGQWVPGIARRPSPGEDAAEDPAHVRVDRGDGDAERNRGNRPGGVRPDPGRRSSSSTRAGIRPLCSATITRAARCRFTARRLYPRPPHWRRTSAGAAPASASTVGKRSRNARQAGSIRPICVCWSITSETRIAYGSAVRRKARSRPLASNQRRSAQQKAAASSGLRPRGGRGSDGDRRPGIP